MKNHGQIKKMEEYHKIHHYLCQIDHAQHRDINNEMKMLVLLYEFPAETRLTVYRRLDILVQ